MNARTLLNLVAARFGGMAMVLSAGLTVMASGSAGPELQPASSRIHHPWPGGVDPRPVITGMSAADQEGHVLLQWIGWGGPYRVQQASEPGTWSAAGGPTMEESLIAPANGASLFFRVEGPRPVYLSASTCVACHATAHQGWMTTAHATALETLKRIGQAANPQCLPCHTVGYGMPGGFVDEASTPLLAGVQCENCHGPGGNHVADPGDLSARPVASLASMTCGGCHNDFHHPTYDEWLTAGHAGVVASVVDGFLNPDVAAAESRMRSCGACHSGAVRLAMLKGAEEGIDLPPMPGGDEAARTPITCAVCHTAHEKTEFGAQLRNPTHSMEFHSYSTAANSSFTRQYNRNVNLCGQCHNMRGAVWTDTSRPPHHSVQYNVLIGSIGLEFGTPRQSSHRDIAKQCAHCHTHGRSPENPSEESPVYTGHAFEPRLENCAPCHTPEQAANFVSFTQTLVRQQMNELKALLDAWGETKAPEALRTKYGKLAWEFNNAGQLSLAPDGSSQRGPTAQEQAETPDVIKQARFILYMIEHDGSYGVHNGLFARDSLAEAKRRVQALMDAE
jgi:hypothetical protein